MFNSLGFHKDNGKLNWLVIFISMLWGYSTLGNFVRATFMRIPMLSDGYGFPALYTLYTVGLLLALPSIFRRLRLPCLLFPIAVLVYYLISYSLYPRSAPYLDDNATRFFFTVLPMFFIGAVWNSDELIKPLRLVSLLSIFFSIFHRLFFAAKLSAAESAHGDAMGPAYAILPHLCLITYFAISRKSFVDIVFTLVGIVFMMTLGTRGPVLCYGLFIIMCYAFTLKKKGALLLLAGMVPVGVVFLSESFHQYLKALILLCKQFGVSARIFDRMLEGEFFDSSGRDSIQDTLLSKVADHHFIGYGFYADRAMLPRGRDGFGRQIHFYAHNLVLELWMNFGRITGSILFACLLLLIWRKLAKSPNQQTRLFVVLFTCCAVGHLMLSSTYLEHGLFFLLLGMLMTRERPELISHQGRMTYEKTH